MDGYSFCVIDPGRLKTSVYEMFQVFLKVKVNKHRDLVGVFPHRMNEPEHDTGWKDDSVQTVEPIYYWGHGSKTCRDFRSGDTLFLVMNNDDPCKSTDPCSNLRSAQDRFHPSFKHYFHETSASTKLGKDKR